MKKNYIFYQRTEPFPGWIRMVGQVDPDQIPDGSTLKERLDQLLIKYPDSGLKLFPSGVLPDPETVKYDEATETLVPLEVGDIVPKAQESLDQTQKAKAYIDNLPSRAVVMAAIDNAFPDTKQKNIVTKLADVVYWLAKDTEE